VSPLEQTGASAVPARKMKRNNPLSRTWRRIRKPLAESRLAKNALASALHGFMALTQRTNPIVASSDSLVDFFRGNDRVIYALWHGQHLIAPALNPRWHPLVAMFSRSADAELNALVAHRFGLETARGSGGREKDRAKANEKGGARALIALKKALDQGKSVCMIADIPHGEPRQAGLGIVTLARISGRPIVPVAIATSRRKVLEKSWDKTTINLPFGRCATVLGAPVSVPADADEAELERCRVAITSGLNAATAKAYHLVDGAA
jgi:lysophospholipid acyltransferase (LPLAT)-like uncharacterized protein